MLNLVGEKLGMSHCFSESGLIVPLTLLKIHDNIVLDLLINESSHDNILVAFERLSSLKKISKPLAGVFNKKSLQAFRKVKGSRIKKDSGLKIGQIIDLDLVFKKGDKVNVSGTTIGKGFSGAMKRWNFSGLEASHGVSVSHRSHGSTGQRQDPGKTFKGKKMAGHMGVKQVTTKNLEILSIDKSRSVITVKGSIPGNSGRDIVVKVYKNF